MVGCHKEGNSVWAPRRVGHGPFGAWPPPIWRKLFYDPRPDIVTSKTRAPEWKQLHSDWRFFQALFCYVGPPSHILWNIKWPFLGVMVVAGLMALFEQYRVEHDIEAMDPNGLIRDCFRLTSYAMALLLTFRVNRSYERWGQARSSMAGVGNGATTIFLLATTYVKDDAILDDFRRYCIVWPYSILQACTFRKSLDPLAATLLHPEEMELYKASRKGRQVVVTKVRQLAQEANLTTEQAINMEVAIAATWKSAGDALRIRFQAMPHGLTLMCTGFVQLWCILLPIALWTMNNTPDWQGIPALAFVAMLLLGCDEMAHQLEDPFEIMPLDDIMATYERDINRVRDEADHLKQISRITRNRKTVPNPDESRSTLPTEHNAGCQVSTSEGILLSPVHHKLIGKSLGGPVNSQQALLMQGEDADNPEDYVPPVKVS